MSKIIYLALENLHQRFNVMMNETISPHVHHTIYPVGYDYLKIKHGQFIDINQTIRFKAAQLQIVAEMFANGEILNGDTFLIADIFFPGIESIRYMADLQGVRVRIFGFNYAGRADEHDFVQRLGEWSDYSERGYHSICDGIFVGSEFHKANVVAYFGLPPDKIHVTGYIWNLHWIDKLINFVLKDVVKEDYVIWPHRFAEEKGLDELESYVSGTKRKVLITSCGNPNQKAIAFALEHKNVEYLHSLTKVEYYRLFRAAKFYLSTAYQETFGYTLQEAILFNCKIIVPKRACYPEMVPAINVYDPEILRGPRFSDALDYMLDSVPIVPITYTMKWNDNVDKVMQIIKG
jgi:glycosyltransferase involved in cell wall biosynthesis